MNVRMTCLAWVLAQPTEPPTEVSLPQATESSEWGAPEEADPPTTADVHSSESAPPVVLEYQEVEVPSDIRSTIERVTAERLYAHALGPSDLGVVIRWRDRDSLLYEIAIRVGDAVEDGSKLTLACPQCSGEELAENTVKLLDRAILELQERRARLAPPPPVIVAPEPPRPAVTITMQERRWPLRRGLAAGLVAAGAAATMTGIVLSALPDRKVILEETFFERTFINYDYRTPGFVTVGIGAAALVGGAVWLAIEQRRTRNTSSAARSRPHLGVGSVGWEVAF